METLRKINRITVTNNKEREEKYDESNPDLSSLTKTQDNHLVQKLIDEVTKKEEKWTKEQDQLLIKLVREFKVENIYEVHLRLNKFINSQKKNVPQSQHHILC